MIAAIILLALKRSDKKKYMLKNGVKIDVEQRIEELEETLSQKEVLIQSYLDGHTIEEMHEIWRGAEKLLKDSSEDERRYAISRPAAGFEEGLSEIHAKLEPVLEKIGYIQSGIDNLRASSGVSFTEANDALNGIDAEIDRLANLYKAYELAAEVLEESMNGSTDDSCPRLCSDTENIFERITGRRIHVKISDDFTISVYDEDVPRSISSYSGATVDQAYFSLRLAIARMLAPKNECYPVMLDDSFVQYDDERMANGLGFLADYARSPNKGSVGDDASGRSQIIFVTCQRRAADIAGDTVIAI